MYKTVAGKRERRNHCEPFVHWMTFKFGNPLIRQKRGIFEELCVCYIVESRCSVGFDFSRMFISVLSHMIAVVLLCLQMVIQSGYMPTVLQQLCNLPFPYFSNPALSAVLFPTLLACCSDNQQNRAILEQEVSFQVGLICLSSSLNIRS